MLLCLMYGVYNIPGTDPHWFTCTGLQKLLRFFKFSYQPLEMAVNAWHFGEPNLENVSVEHAPEAPRSSRLQRSHI